MTEFGRFKKRRAQRTSEPPEDNRTSSSLSPPSIKSSALEEVQPFKDAVVEAAATSGGLWLSYLFVLLYFLVAVSGVTQRDLFFENPVRVPFLSIDLPLRGFFWLGPGLFIVVHAYILIHFLVLAGKLRALNEAIRARISDDGFRTSVRRQLPSNIFVQALAGPREIRDGIVGKLLWTIAAISLVAGPIFLLLFFQLKFLPFHDESITWWQRVVAIADIGLLWTFWPGIITGKGTALALKLVKRASMAGALIATCASLTTVLVVGTFPGETLRAAWVFLGVRADHIVASLAGEAVGFPIDSLQLANIDVVDHDKLRSDAEINGTRQTLLLADRHLEGADLSGATLKKVDFSGAFLEGANLSYSELQGARFHHSHLNGANLSFTRLEGADFTDADLNGAALQIADLQGTDFFNAELRAAKLASAKLNGAYLRGANLAAADLQSADLNGANLDGAYLYGATFEAADLQGASIVAACAWRADIRQANNVDLAIIKDTELSLGSEPCMWSEADAVTIMAYASDGSSVALASMTDPAKQLADERAISDSWVTAEQHALGQAASLSSGRLEILRETACFPNGAPYILTSFVKRRLRGHDSLLIDEWQKLAAAILVPDRCAGTFGIPDVTRQWLWGYAHSQPH